MKVFLLLCMSMAISCSATLVQLANDRIAADVFQVEELVFADGTSLTTAIQPQVAWPPPEIVYSEPEGIQAPATLQLVGVGFHKTDSALVCQCAVGTNVSFGTTLGATWVDGNHVSCAVSQELVLPPRDGVQPMSGSATSSVRASWNGGKTWSNPHYFAQSLPLPVPSLDIVPGGNSIFAIGNGWTFDASIQHMCTFSAGGDEESTLGFLLDPITVECPSPSIELDWKAVGVEVSGVNVHIPEWDKGYFAAKAWGFFMTNGESHPVLHSSYNVDSIRRVNYSEYEVDFIVPFGGHYVVLGACNGRGSGGDPFYLVDGAVSPSTLHFHCHPGSPDNSGPMSIIVYGHLSSEPDASTLAANGAVASWVTLDEQMSNCPSYPQACGAPYSSYRYGGASQSDDGPTVYRMMNVFWDPEFSTDKYAVSGTCDGNDEGDMLGVYGPAMFHLESQVSNFRQTVNHTHVCCRQMCRQVKYESYDVLSVVAVGLHDVSNTESDLTGPGVPFGYAVLDGMTGQLLYGRGCTDSRRLSAGLYEIDWKTKPDTYSTLVGSCENGFGDAIVLSQWGSPVPSASNQGVWKDRGRVGCLKISEVSDTHAQLTDVTKVYVVMFHA